MPSTINPTSPFASDEAAFLRSLPNGDGDEDQWQQQLSIDDKARATFRQYDTRHTGVRLRLHLDNMIQDIHV